MKYVGIMLFLLLWALLSYLEFVNPIFIPNPHSTFAKLLLLFTEKIFYYDILSSIYRVLSGIIISLFIGIPVGLILGNSAKLYKVSELLIDFFRSIPATALFPLALLFFGIGDMAKIGIVSFSCTLIMILQTYYGASNASKLKIDVLKTMKATKCDTFKYLLVYEALPHIFAGIRVIVSLSLILVIVTEMFIGTEYGLGKRLIDAQSTYRISELYAVIIFIGILGYELNQITLLFEKKLVHWNR